MMSSHSEAESPLMDYINNDRLRHSLVGMRQALEDIWASDAPRIVKDYTDHGVEHSKRVEGFAAKLLAANAGPDLLENEIYLLLAGVYLHDIGMQCDIVKFPRIKAGAEALGAAFDCSFTARTSSGYSLAEQKAVRRNHHYLTAAWIRHAYSTGETTLARAVRTVPSQLVEDLMDVCLYHSQVPITECPVNGRIDQTGRKRFVAAILRFADELDVDAPRVSISTAKLFAIDPHNALYWWLHHHTTLTFSARRVILILIRLHPGDMLYEPLVYNRFIGTFQEKNQRVLTVLGKNDIPIVINAESRVEEYQFAERLPPEVTQILDEMREERPAQESGTARTAARSEHMMQTRPGEALRGRGTSKCVLVVEDDPNWRALLRRLLESNRYRVEQAVEYSEALDQILKSGEGYLGFRIDLCVTDLRLGSPSVRANYDALGLLAVCQLKQVPAVVVSAHLGRELTSQLLGTYGALACFDKASFSEYEFLDEVRNVLADTGSRT